LRNGGGGIVTVRRVPSGYITAAVQLTGGAV
jgi:hypothetical protein